MNLLQRATIWTIAHSVLGCWGIASAAATPGPLRVHPTNPRYFTDGTTNADGSLRALYLGGHQIFVDLQDNSFNLKLTRSLAQRARDLARMNPRQDLASTGYCLANDGQEYVVFAPKHEAFEVRGLRAGQTYRYEWFDTLKPSAREVGSMVARAGPHRFQPPGPGAVLSLTPAGRSNLSR